MNKKWRGMTHSNDSVLVIKLVYPVHEHVVSSHCIYVHHWGVQVKMSFYALSITNLIYTAHL